MKEDEQHNFKVVDKRRFSSDGEFNNKESLSNDADSSGASRVNVDSFDDHLMSDLKSDPLTSPEINFPSFLMGMYTQTLIYLGDIPSPDTNRIESNLDAGKQNIDILSVIEDKTKGNLSPEEEGLFKEILTTLRLQFVKKTKK